MILNRNFYSKISFISAFWYQRQASKLQHNRIFKAFNLHQTEWPNKLYFYSPRLKRIPRFMGDKSQLSNWKDAKMCERVCPTNAITVTAETIHIDERGCIACGLCVKFAPAGLIEFSSEVLQQLPPRSPSAFL